MTKANRTTVGPGRPLALILGPNPAACRAFEEAGIPVAMVNSEPPPHPYPGLVYHWCPRFAIRDTDSEWLPAMLRLARSVNEGDRPILFPTTDEAMLAVAENRAALDAAFVVMTSPPAIVRTLVNKADFAE